MKVLEYKELGLAGCKMKVGFIGLGNVGSKLAGSLLRNKFDLTVRDLDHKLTKNFHEKIKVGHHRLIHFRIIQVHAIKTPKPYININCNYYNIIL